MGDKIWLRVSGERAPQGPYLISAARPEAAKYRLSLEDGTPVNNGKEVDGNDLKRAEGAGG